MGTENRPLYSLLGILSPSWLLSRIDYKVYWGRGDSGGVGAAIAHSPSRGSDPILFRIWIVYFIMVLIVTLRLPRQRQQERCHLIIYHDTLVQGRFHSMCWINAHWKITFKDYSIIISNSLLKKNPTSHLYSGLFYLLITTKFHSKVLSSYAKEKISWPQNEFLQGLSVKLNSF